MLIQYELLLTLYELRVAKFAVKTERRHAQWHFTQVNILSFRRLKCLKYHFQNNQKRSKSRPAVKLIFMRETYKESIKICLCTALVSKVGVHSFDRVRWPPRKPIVHFSQLLHELKVLKNSYAKMINLTSSNMYIITLHHSSRF